ncbi:hypothetical protein IHE61_27235 [Streptomyces sp. GKU 257-1]|nr:hypothetical protein [Streptomyces sp. GKU 257-1]
MTALPMPVVDHIRSVYQAKIEQERINEWALNWGQDDEFEPVHWPDGPYQDPRGRRPGTNYSSHDEYEYFAQLSNAYLGTNTGIDPYTGQPHNNGAQWVRDNDPALLPLLERLYGPVSEQGGLKANPYAEVQARKAAAVADDGARTGTTSSRPEAAATTAGETDAPPVLPEDQGQDTTADETVVASVLPLDPGTSTEETAPAPEPPRGRGHHHRRDHGPVAARERRDVGRLPGTVGRRRSRGQHAHQPSAGHPAARPAGRREHALRRPGERPGAAARRLPGLAERAPEAHAWLADPARVRRDLAGPADALPDTPHAVVLTAVRGLVADRLQADRGRGATEALWQYRLSNLGDDSFAARVAGMDLAELVTRLDELGVPLPDQTAFETEEGLRGELSDLLLRHEPLDDRELTALTARRRPGLDGPLELHRGRGVPAAAGACPRRALRDLPGRPVRRGGRPPRLPAPPGRRPGRRTPHRRAVPHHLLRPAVRHRERRDHHPMGADRRPALRGQHRRRTGHRHPARERTHADAGGAGPAVGTRSGTGRRAHLERPAGAGGRGDRPRPGGDLRTGPLRRTRAAADRPAVPRRRGTARSSARRPDDQSQRDRVRAGAGAPAGRRCAPGTWSPTRCAAPHRAPSPSSSPATRAACPATPGRPTGSRTPTYAAWPG